MASPQLVEAVVARGRTVYAGARIASAPGADGKAVEVLVKAAPVATGGKIKLPADEVAWLRLTGHLEDPGVESIPFGDGPNFGTSGGPTVKGVA